MPGRRHGGLHHDDVSARLDGYGREPLGTLRGDSDSALNVAGLDLLDSLRHELVLYGRLVEPLQQGGRLFDGGLGNLGELVGGVGVASPEALQVQDGETAELAHLDGKVRRDHGIHGGGENGDGEVVLTNGEAHVYLFWVDGDLTGDYSYLVETITTADLLEAGHPH